jgi:hypothetical protein
MPDDALLDAFAELKRLKGASADMPDDPRHLAAWLASRWQETTPMVAARLPRRTPPARRQDARTVSRCSFARLVLLHVTLSGFEADDRDVCEWVDSCWPLIEDQGQDPAKWARNYMVACGLVSEQPRETVDPGA